MNSCLTNETKLYPVPECKPRQKFGAYEHIYSQLFTKDPHTFYKKYGEFSNFIHNNKINYIYEELLHSKSQEKGKNNKIILPALYSEGKKECGCIKKESCTDSSVNLSRMSRFKGKKEGEKVNGTLNEIEAIKAPYMYYFSIIYIDSI